MNLKYFLPQYIAELIGSYFLVFFGCGAMILADLNNWYPLVSIPLIFGGIITTMIYALGHISGAHFNPAVTIAFWSVNKFPASKIAPYISFQLIGAILASLSHWFILGGEHGFGVTQVSIHLWGGFFVEFLLSFFLMFVITSVATDSRAVGEMAGIAIGGAVGLCAFVGGPLTNASMNPARSLGPAIVKGDFTLIWLFIIATILGAIVGAHFYEWIKCHKEKISDSGCC